MASIRAAFRGEEGLCRVCRIIHRRYIIAAAVFIFHFAVAWSYGRPYIYSDIFTSILDPLRWMLQSGHLHGKNFYTGVPFFLLPIFHIVGSSPDVVRVLLVSFMAASSSIAYLVYTQLFGPLLGLIGVLLLLSSNVWITFTYEGYTYTTFFAVICLYLFVRWDTTANPHYLYGLSFLAGIFFYFKALIAYPVIGLATGALLAKPRRVKQLLRPRKIAVLASVFLLGLAPFLKFSIERDFYYLSRMTTVSDNYATGTTLGDIVASRITHIFHVHSPTSFVRGVETPGLEGYLAIGLLTAGIILSVKHREKPVYAATILVMILLSLYVPNNLNFRQTVVFLPFTVILMLVALKQYLQPRHRLLHAIGLLLVAGILLTLPIIHTEAQTEWRGYRDNPFVLGQETFEEYQQLNLSQRVATNSYLPFVSGKVDLCCTERIYMLIPPEEAIPGKRRVAYDWTRRSFRNMPSGRVDLLLRENLPCLLDHRFCAMEDCEEYCGYSAEEIRRYAGLDAANAETVQFNGWQYLLYRNVSIAADAANKTSLR